MSRQKSSLRSLDDRVFDSVVVALLVLLGLCFILPFMNIISLSISDQYAIMRGDVTFLPKGFNLASYEKLFQTDVVLKSYSNTLFVAIVGCVCSLLMTAIAAYPLVFAEFSFKKLNSVFIMFTMWFTGGMVPTYIVMTRYGLVDNLWVLILNSLISAYHVLVLKSFYAGIPRELAESAKIDGANDWRILFQIMLSISTIPILLLLPRFCRPKLTSSMPIRFWPKRLSFRPSVWLA